MGPRKTKLTPEQIVTRDTARREKAMKCKWWDFAAIFSALKGGDA